MSDHAIFESRVFKSIPEKIGNNIPMTHNMLGGTPRRLFVASIVSIFGYGGQSLAEREFCWNCGTIRKGMHEIDTGIVCQDNFSGRGRKKIEEKLPNLLRDIRDIANPISQADPRFKTTLLYVPITAQEVRNRLVEEKGYENGELPSVRTITPS